MSTPPSLHLAWPPTIVEQSDGSRAITEVPQDSGPDLEGSVLLLSALRRGQLDWAEEVGITDPLGTTDPDDAAALIETDLRRLEPRPAGVQVQVVPQPGGNRSIRLKVIL